MGITWLYLDQLGYWDNDVQNINRLNGGQKDIYMSQMPDVSLLHPFVKQ